MIYIITTDGTIEGLEYDRIVEKPKEVQVKIQYFLEAANVSFQYIVDCVSFKDSRHITQDDRKLLTQKIESTKTEKILITHGTYTMVETAKYLGKLNLDKTIVLVGAFILGFNKNTDAPFNLGYALCTIQTKDKGVYVAMNGTVFSWGNVVKNVGQNRFENSSEI